MCASSLDHITPSCLATTRPQARVGPDQANSPSCLDTHLTSLDPRRWSCSTTLYAPTAPADRSDRHPLDSRGLELQARHARQDPARPRRLLTRPRFSKSTASLQRDAVSIRSACCRSSRPSWQGRRWWVWVDSNHRPYPYQGYALTT